MKSRILIIGVLILVALLLWAWSSKAKGHVEEVANERLLQDLICEFPCWRNIRPRNTSFERAMSILQQDEKIKIYFITKDTISFLFDNTSGGVVATEDGMVDYIILTAPNVSLGDFVEFAGLPEKIAILQIPNVPEICQSSILFPKRGVILDLNLEDKSGSFSDCQINIDSSSKIFRIILLAKNFSSSKFWETSGYSSLDYFEWKGFGEYP